MTPCLISMVLAMALPSAVQDAAESTDWPQWRGPSRDGLVAGHPEWPDRLAGDALQPLWRVPLGPSYSGPVVSADRVYTTETRNGSHEVVRALDRLTGKILWEAAWEGALSVPFFAKANGDWIRSTPALDVDRLYVAGMRDLLVCLDAASGREIWRVDFVKQTGSALPSFGCVSSPLVDGEFVYVQAGSAFVKLEKATGRIEWKALVNGGGMEGGAFSSPITATIGGLRQLLVQTRSTLAGVNPADGAVLWSRDIPAFRGMNILTPVVAGDDVFTSSYGGRSLLLSPRLAQDRWTVTEAWSEAAQGYMSTPIVIEGHAYAHLRSQRFACFDLSTGRQTWVSPPYGKYCSLVAQGRKILALDERGELLLLRADPTKFDLLESHRISDKPTWAHLAVTGPDLFIRELEALAAFKWSKPGTPQ